MKNILVILATITFLFVYLRYIERRSLYIPFRQIDETPESLGLSFKDIYIQTPDKNKINAWFIPARGAIDGHLTLLFLHGNGGNLSHRLSKIAFFYDLGMDVFIIDYRGYGRSLGRPSEEGLYIDARSGYKYLRDVLGIQVDKIVVFGESLGGAVAIDLVKDVKVRALILEGVFTSVADMSRTVYPFLPPIFLATKFDSLNKIRDISVPKYFIHSRNDEVVPFEMGLKLFQAAGEPKTFTQIHGGHNEAFFSAEDKLKRDMKLFLDSIK